MRCCCYSICWKLRSFSNLSKTKWLSFHPIKGFHASNAVQCWSQIIANWSVNVNRFVRWKLVVTIFHHHPSPNQVFEKAVSKNPWYGTEPMGTTLECSTRHSARDWHLFLRSHLRTLCWNRADIQWPLEPAPVNCQIHILPIGIKVLLILNGFHLLVYKVCKPSVQIATGLFKSKHLQCERNAGGHN